MARIGVANYQHSTASPVLQDKYWRETLERGQRDHAFSVFNDPFPKASYAYLNTTSNDFLGRTWQVLHHTKSAAAGKCSFHHNVAKPMTNAVKANSSTMAFEVRPRSHRSTSAAAHSVLGSASMPSLREGVNFEDDARSVASSRRSVPSQRSGAQVYAVHG